MKALGGRILARLWPTSSEERQRTIDAGHDLDRILDTNDLVTSDNTIFVATGITPGDLVDGVTYLPNGGADPVDRDAVGLWDHPLPRASRGRRHRLEVSPAPPSAAHRGRRGARHSVPDADPTDRTASAERTDNGTQRMDNR